MNDEIPLGKEVVYPTCYDPELLYPVPRALGRKDIGIGKELPFGGVDIWNAYELSWLERGGKPVVAMGEFRFSVDSVNIIESKSLKLYLNSFNLTSFSSSGEVAEIIRRDLEKLSQGTVQVSLVMPEGFHRCRCIEPAGVLIDDIDLQTSCYSHNPGLLKTGSGRVQEVLYSHLLRTNCPVTGQPDWATLVIDYAGSKIDRAALLRYIISFREHTGFHENCVEQIYQDLTARCGPERLSVYARFTRRGGIDINPFRTSREKYTTPENIRFARQ